ncbi:MULTISPECIES: tol-pal system YbgF family protein [unclassified Treponema]|uniref:tetratricopeptide repeat protein n=1 Tax=unclassified Treponema TaxID=2638727 RepID=UPI0020A4F9D2|nr:MULTISPECIES: hypothetical protein [unclassified Treponema]UTC65849.1 hypothetical protein E4O06_07330 [Treponema sp. OMZ 789]UTC68577.1 hypothetical protein E4O01_07470 [Treponema sp. OMZ 790]UTC71308.1 hypothetical protein E4O02_07665 [Treponema sp. OMZ 791]
MKKGFIIFLFFVAAFGFAEEAPIGDKTVAGENELQQIMPEVRPDKTGSEKIEFSTQPQEEEKTEEFAFISFSILLREKSVMISWKAKPEGRNLIIYRSTSSFSSISSLAEAIPIANITDKGLPFFDSPIPGIPYYYAIAEENEIASGNIQFINGINTISSPVEVFGSVGDQNKKPQNRPVPLPFLNLAKQPKKRAEFFSSQTETLINTLTAEKKDYREFIISSQRLEPYIFPDDKKTPDGGESMELQRILNDYFYTKNWQKCENELTNFLRIRRTSRISARTHFYIGQTLFFQNMYDKALLEFLTAQDMYPSQAKEWAHYCLLELANSPKK